MNANTKGGTVRGLWGLVWRMVLFAPVGMLGLLGFAGITLLSFGLPIFACALSIEGRWWEALLTGLVWWLWLRHGKPIREFFLEGFEHSL